MAEIKIKPTKKFRKDLDKITDRSIIKQIRKRIKKIAKNPCVGKPLRYTMAGERTIRVKTYRLIYSYIGNVIYLLKIKHRKKAYKK